MKEAHISAVIFDLDGTLLDTETLHKTLLIEFLEKYGKIVDSEKEEKRVGQSMKEFAISIVSDYELPMTPDEFSDQIMPMSVQRWHQVKALPGVNRLMSYLHKNHYPMAIASNSTRKNILTKISHQLGWKEKFCVFVGGDEVKNGKPSPDIFIEAAKRLGVDASNCLVIEDSLVGVRAAKDSGAYVVAVPSLPNQDNHYFIAHSILHSLLEFQPESWRLPAFDDLVQKVLPIEVLTIHGYIVGKAAHNGCTLDIIEGARHAFEVRVISIFFHLMRLLVYSIRHEVFVGNGPGASTSNIIAFVLFCLFTMVLKLETGEARHFGSINIYFKIYTAFFDLAKLWSRRCNPLICYFQFLTY